MWQGKPATQDIWEAAGGGDMWMNDKYVVIHRREQHESGPMVHHLSIRRQDRGTDRDWRDFQRIKNQLLGDDAEAIELYPAEDRVVDTANQFHLWSVEGHRIPLGWEAGQIRMTNDQVSSINAKQRDFDHE